MVLAGRLGHDINGNQLFEEREALLTAEGVVAHHEREFVHRLFDAIQAGRARAQRA